MNVKEKRYTNDLRTIIWALRLALSINKKILLFWIFFSTLIALLPTFSVIIYQKCINTISNVILLENSFALKSLLYTIGLGFVYMLIGLSNRVNKDLLYMLMYDYYHIGMQETIMNSVKNVGIRTLRNKKYINEYKAMLNRAGALNDFLVSLCLLISKSISLISLIFVMYQFSNILVIVTSIYIIIVVIVNGQLSIKTQYNKLTFIEEERKIELMLKQVSIPGVAKEIRIFNNKEKIYQQWENEYNKLEQMEKKILFWRSFISFIGGCLYYLFIVIVLFYSLLELSKGKFEVSAFIVLITIGQNITKNLQVLSETIQIARAGIFNLSLQKFFIEKVPKDTVVIEKNNSVKDDSIVIKLNNVSFSYNDEREVLHNLSLSIKKGEKIALVGCNGSGKSTLVNLITNVYSPTKGEILLYGHRYQSYTRNEIAEQIGVYFQDSTIFHTTIRENVGFGDINKLEDIEAINHALVLGDAKKIVDRYETGIEQWLMKYVINEGVILSGGEQQKIKLSRAYMNDKPIMIFDEPASALDPIAEIQQFEKIRSELENQTAILISHRIGFARFADRIVVLDNGRIVEEGSHSQLIQQKGVYAKLFNEQAQWYK